MIPTYQTGNDVTLTFDYPMIGTEVVSPISVDFEVVGGDGAVVLARSPVPSGGYSDPAGRIMLVIPGASNVVPDGAFRIIRSVRVTFTMANGQSLVLVQRYVCEVIDKLVVMGNSFQTMEQAILTRLDLPNQDGWDTASESDQIAGLITAHDRMCRLTFRYRLSQDALEWGMIRRDPYWIVSDMRLRDIDAYNQFPEDFKTALNRAQLYEANTVIGGDPIGDRRAMGIVSETTGEAKMFFSNRVPLRHPICADALNVLSSYLYSSTRIGRG